MVGSSSGGGRMPPKLLMELANRAGVEYNATYVTGGAAHGCLGIRSDLKGLLRFDAQMRAVQEQRQQQGDMNGYLEIQDLYRVMDRFRYNADDDMYYWAHIAVR